MTMRTVFAAGIALALLPGVLLGQNAPPPTQDGQAVGPPGDTAVVELVLRREAFTYPSFVRRNPFLPLTSASETGPRFDQMRLTGILYDPSNAARSIAVITVGAAEPGAGGGAGALVGGDPGSDPRGQVERLRVGERWGNVRVISIGPDVVVVDVAEFGIEERREMRLQSRSQGGS